MVISLEGLVPLPDYESLRVGQNRINTLQILLLLVQSHRCKAIVFITCMDTALFNLTQAAHSRSPIPDPSHAHLVLQAEVLLGRHVQARGKHLERPAAFMQTCQRLMAHAHAIM